MVLPGLRTPEQWNEERLTTYRKISRSVQDLHDRLCEVEVALEKFKTQRPDLSLGGVANSVSVYNAAQASKTYVNLDLIADVQYAGNVFEKQVKTQAMEMYAILWSEEAEPNEAGRVKELRAARALVRQIVEKDLVAWKVVWPGSDDQPPVTGSDAVKDG